MSGRGPKYKPPNQGIIKRKGKTLGPGGKGLPKGWNTQGRRRWDLRPNSSKGTQAGG